MTINIVLLGGNGYLGRALTQLWLTKDSQADFWILSRSGLNRLVSAQVHNRAVNLDDWDQVIAALPTRVDFVVDLIGGPAKDPEKAQQLNQRPAQLMLRLATYFHVRAMGFIGGKLGPKPFITMKADLIKTLQASTVPLAYVEPTLVYGNGRRDAMTRWVPLLKVLGIFIPNCRPAQVDRVVADLQAQLIQLGRPTSTEG